MKVLPFKTVLRRQRMSNLDVMSTKDTGLLALCRLTQTRL
jgi:hypothetical protein